VNNRILIVEDSLMLAKIIIEEFETHNSFKVDHTKSVYETKTVLKVKDYDMILLDCNLPDGKSCDILTFLDGLNKKSKPIIYLTSGDSSYDYNKYDRFYAKPYDLDVLVKKMKVDLSA